MAHKYFCDETKLLILKEETQDLYWKQHGKPTQLKPDLIPCLSPQKLNQTCESFIELKDPRDS
jgi:hypothetical protein